MMTLTRWSPFRELELMERNMRRLVEPFAPVLPAADVYETKDEFVVELEVPGYEEKELGIEITDHLLTITGEHEVEKEETDKVFRLHERIERHFERRFELPQEVDTKKLQATFRQGVLELHAPKAPAAISKKIAIGKG